MRKGKDAACEDRPKLALLESAVAVLSLFEFFRQGFVRIVVECINLVKVRTEMILTDG